MIQLKSIKKVYQTPAGEVPALHAVDLTVKAGQIFGVIGQSGAGKSTLIRCVNLLERPTHGQVLIGGDDLMQLDESALRQKRHKMGMIFQHFNLLDSRTVAANVALPLELAGEPRRQIRKRVDELLALTNLSARCASYPRELSGGQKQRVAIARALAFSPDILLCDEATSALDPQTTRSILDLLKDINQRLGVTILLITHEMAVVKTLCDKMAVIDQGRLVEQGQVVEVFSKPQHPATQKLLGNSHRLPQSYRERVVATPEPERQTPVLHLSFVGAVAQEPVVARLGALFGVETNILAANIESVQKTTVGLMTLELLQKESNQQHKLPEIMHFLKERGIHSEVLGYV